MRARTIAGVLTALVLALAVAAAPGAAGAPFTRIVVFGTSLSDSGNAFALLGTANNPSNFDLDALFVPGSPYDRGGHHFSNGATWIEQFARSRGLAGTVRPAFAGDDPNATNYAVGGARAREDGKNVNLPEQVNAFLERFNGVAPSDALYVIDMGGNDIRDALGAVVAGQDPAPIIQGAVVSVLNTVVTLYGHGARHFLIWRAPDVGLTPAANLLGPAAAAGASALTVTFNDALDQVVAGLGMTLPGIKIDRLDAFTLVHGIVATPAAFDLTNVTLPCVRPGVAPFFCQQPDQYLFWDGIHPTAAGHAILAQEAARVLMK